MGVRERESKTRMATAEKEGREQERERKRKRASEEQRRKKLRSRYASPATLQGFSEAAHPRGNQPRQDSRAWRGERRRWKGTRRFAGEQEKLLFFSPWRRRPTTTNDDENSNVDVFSSFCVRMAPSFLGALQARSRREGLLVLGEYASASRTRRKRARERRWTRAK